MEQLVWGDDSVELTIGWAPDVAPTLQRIRTATTDQAFGGGVALVEILAVPYGHTPASDRLVGTVVGRALRYLRHEIDDRRDGSGLRLSLIAVELGVQVDLVLWSPAGVAALQAHSVVTNIHPREGLALQSATSWVSPFGHSPTLTGGPEFAGWRLLCGVSDWLAEGRWSETDLRSTHFPPITDFMRNHDPRGALTSVSTGTWSTGRQLPVAAIVSSAQSLATVWQVEHNGAWRWEVGENEHDGYVALSGPTEIDHDWMTTLAPGSSFVTVPVGVAFGHDLSGALAALTDYRRAMRRPHEDNLTMPVVFNDYMNTLNGDPTTEKLIPLVDAAAQAGAEIFCIDAGWYDDGGNWWPSVGEWKPSTTRFPGGLATVVDRIRERGMVPGLWLEPEVVGVLSPAASALPDDAFFQRHEHRVVEHERYHLDMRHPAARAHLDEVIDRLIEEFGIGYFKLDYNINPGIGTDVATESKGAALLEHNRAHLAWIDGVLDRHPKLVLENCGSGAMRMDFALLSRMQLQSTSDQQDFRHYPVIAAAAPLSMLPEQAANWAYPQPEMSDERIAFSLATGMLGRLYLSGYLNRMSEGQRTRVAEAVTVQKALRGTISASRPFWPAGLPRWDAAWVALGLEADDVTMLTVWNREADGSAARLTLPHLAGRSLHVRTLFPTELGGWEMEWDEQGGTLSLRNLTGDVSARVIELSTARPGLTARES